MSTLVWIVVIAGGWLLLAAVVALLLGRVIRLRDRPHKPPHVERPHRRRPQDWPPGGHR